MPSSSVTVLRDDGGAAALDERQQLLLRELDVVVISEDARAQIVDGEHLVHSRRRVSVSVDGSTGRIIITRI